MERCRRGKEGRRAGLGTGSPIMSSTVQDLRYAFRQLRGAPVFTAVAVLSLGLGIGSITTVLCWIENLLWRPFPVWRDQGRVVVVVGSQGGRNVSIPDLRDIDAAAGRLRGRGRLPDHTCVRHSRRQSEWLYGQIATANFFEVLGRQAHPREDLPARRGREAGREPRRRHQRDLLAAALRRRSLRRRPDARCEPPLASPSWASSPPASRGR